MKHLLDAHSLIWALDDFGCGRVDTPFTFYQPATGGNRHRPATTRSTARSWSSDSRHGAVPLTSSRISANSGSLASRRRRNRIAGNPTSHWSVNSTKTIHPSVHALVATASAS